MLDWNHPFTTVSKDIHGDNTPQQCTIVAELVTEPISVGWQRNMPVPMAEKDLFSCQNNASIYPVTKGTFLMKSLGKWV
jgi:hypothetical protein